VFISGLFRSIVVLALTAASFYGASRLVFYCFQQFRAFSVLAALMALPVYVAFEIYRVTNDPQLTVWSTFPTLTIYGKAARSVVKYFVFWRCHGRNLTLLGSTYDISQIAKVSSQILFH
jgi:hypothetical protein